jgi:hypothetical protein
MVAPRSLHRVPISYASGDVWTVYEDGCWIFSAHGLSGTGIGDPPEYALLPVSLSKITGVQQRR